MASSFTLEDIRLLEKNISIRERLIDNLTLNKDLPTKARDLDALVNVIESVDRSIFAKAKINIDDNNSKVNEETKEVLKDLLINLHKTSNESARGEAREAPVFQPTGAAVNEGELIPKIDNADVTQFLQN